MNNYNTIELNEKELQSIDGGYKAIVEFGVLVIGAAYGAGYAVGEFFYNVTH